MCGRIGYRLSHRNAYGMSYRKKTDISQFETDISQLSHRGKCALQGGARVAPAIHWPFTPELQWQSRGEMCLTGRGSSVAAVESILGSRFLDIHCTFPYSSCTWVGGEPEIPLHGISTVLSHIHCMRIHSGYPMRITNSGVQVSAPCASRRPLVWR